jgi:hypothetical protein
MRHPLRCTPSTAGAQRAAALERHSGVQQRCNSAATALQQHWSKLHPSTAGVHRVGRGKGRAWGSNPPPPPPPCQSPPRFSLPKEPPSSPPVGRERAVRAVRAGRAGGPRRLAARRGWVGAYRHRHGTPDSDAPLRPALSGPGHLGPRPSRAPALSGPGRPLGPRPGSSRQPGWGRGRAQAGLAPSRRLGWRGVGSSAAARAARARPARSSPRSRRACGAGEGVHARLRERDGPLALAQISGPSRPCGPCRLVSARRPALAGRLTLPASGGDEGWGQG